ncbi:MAG: hypothetical protein PT937_05505 [Lactobacillaceae bacterium]|uniref:hypothetical protein n=1 Tax=Limosilactobacillus sp. TaxID=2773925 RepID=UPI002A75796F|nr:hypothetical protein [Limosilactobacillus sp.]MDD7693811.1 hypothetical protein [Lactobacillaceae bacterium]MDY2803312.1 hypothetical protein [Limosilactobacillus sp.]
MRFNHEVKFYNAGKRKYNPKTSKYEGGTELVADVMANVTDVGTTRSVQLFGSIVQGVKELRLVEPVNDVWAYLTIDDGPTKYRMQTTTTPLKNVSLLVGEDVGKNN